MLATRFKPDTKRLQRWTDRIVKDLTLIGVENGEQLLNDREGLRKFIFEIVDLENQEENEEKYTTLY